MSYDVSLVNEETSLVRYLSWAVLVCDFIGENVLCVEDKWINKRIRNLIA